MTIEQILKKIVSGEPVTDEEKAFLGSYDPNAASNSAAAAARKEAEAKLTKANEANATLQKSFDDMKAKLEGQQKTGDSDLAAAQTQISELSKSLEKMQADMAAERKKVQAAERKGVLDSIRDKAGIQFVPGLDRAMLETSFAGAFAGIEDLTDETIVQTKVDAWKTINAAAILDNSGHGAGAKPGQGAPPQKEPTIEERAAQLSKAGVV